MAHEARTMEYLHQAGYPVPRVDAVSDDGHDLVMERIEGPSMVDALARAPWTVHRQARVLASLHRQLHEITAPDFLGPTPVGQGDRVLHMDLHPLNVIIGRRGPVVIDWTNAGRGAPAVDIGLAWVLISVGEIPQNPVMRKVLGWGRSLLVNGFLAEFDRGEVMAQVRAIVDWKVRDRNMSAPEIAAMWDLVERAEAGA
jgi:aminoglycoside phosphotransferase (APT) family kinase protein